jgi:hypothetical protein
MTRQTLQDELRERATSYRLGGPSSEHTALILEAAAAKIDYLESLIELEREIAEEQRISGDH